MYRTFENYVFKIGRQSHIYLRNELYCKPNTFTSIKIDSKSFLKVKCLLKSRLSLKHDKRANYDSLH